MSDIVLVEANLAQIQVSFDGGKSYHDFINVTNYQENEGTTPVTLKPMLKGVATITGTPQPSTITCNLEYLPHAEVNQLLYDAYEKGTTVLVKWKTKERTIFTNTDDAFSFFMNLTANGANKQPTITSAYFSEVAQNVGRIYNDSGSKVLLGHAIRVGDNVYRIRNIVGDTFTIGMEKNNTDLNISVDKLFVFNHFSIIVPSVERDKFAATITSCDKMSIAADDTITTQVAFQAGHVLQGGRQTGSIPNDKGHNGSNPDHPDNPNHSSIVIPNGYHAANIIATIELQNETKLYEIFAVANENAHRPAAADDISSWAHIGTLDYDLQEASFSTGGKYVSVRADGSYSVYQKTDGAWNHLNTASIDVGGNAIVGACWLPDLHYWLILSWNQTTKIKFHWGQLTAANALQVVGEQQMQNNILRHQYGRTSLTRMTPVSVCLAPDWSDSNYKVCVMAQGTTSGTTGWTIGHLFSVSSRNGSPYIQFSDDDKFLLNTESSRTTGDVTGQPRNATYIPRTGIVNLPSNYSRGGVLGQISIGARGLYFELMDYPTNYTQDTSVTSLNDTTYAPTLLLRTLILARQDPSGFAATQQPIIPTSEISAATANTRSYSDSLTTY